MNTYRESQAFRLYRKNGTVHEVWSRSDSEAIQKGRSWAKPAANLARVARLELNDQNDGCWTRATEHAIYDAD